jgi:asparagine N-glycosylation enzyme membrane subunit Stt3
MRIGNLIAGVAVVAWSTAVLLLAALGHNGFAGDGAYGLGQFVGFAFMVVLFVVGARSIGTELRRRGRR